MTSSTRTRLLVATALAVALSLAGGTAAAELPPGPGDLKPAGPAPDLPNVSIGDAWAYEFEGNINFQLTLDEPVDDGENVVIGFTHLETTDDDFGAQGFNAQFSPGQSEMVVSVPMTQIDGPEPPEHFQLRLLDPVGLEIDDGVGDGLIYDASGPILTIDDPSVVEGDPGDGHTLDFEIVATYAPPEDVTFRFHTGVVGEEAELGSDFLAVDEVLTLEAGSTSVTAHVPVVADDVVEDPEELVIAWLSDISVGDLADDTGVGTIEDDDVEPAPEGTDGDGEDEDEVGGTEADRTRLPSTGAAAYLLGSIGSLLVGLGLLLVLWRRRAAAM